MKIKRWGFYGKDRKTAMPARYSGGREWKKIKKSNVSLRQLSEFQKAVYGGVLVWLGFSIPAKRAGNAAMIITREAER